MLALIFHNHADPFHKLRIGISVNEETFSGIVTNFFLHIFDIMNRNFIIIYFTLTP